MAKVRVYELAKELGVESKVVMAKLQEIGEFVRSASAELEAPVVRKLTDAFLAGSHRQPPMLAPHSGHVRYSSTTERRQSTANTNESKHPQNPSYKQEILETWERINGHVPESKRKNKGAWLIGVSGISRARVHFAESIRNWIAHPDGGHEPDLATLKDALRVMQEIERKLSRRQTR